MEDPRPIWLLFFASLLTLACSQTVHKMAVRSDIRFRFATTEVTCVMSNDNDAAKELVFGVILPKDAFITNFTMEIEGKDYPGEVKEKQKARKQYLHALQSGHSGALVEQSARHSNKFDVSVNVAAGHNVTFTLYYEELLRRQKGAYEHSIYINGKANAEAKEYSIEVYIQDRKAIRNVRTPSLRKDNINEIEEGLNSLTQITNPSETSSYVMYQPTPEELKEQGSGWFVVRYEVDSDDGAGDLLVVDGYFVHFFVPPDGLPPVPLDIVFVLDISGSMQGKKIEQMRNAMHTILNDLRETDRFNILLFDGLVRHWKQSLQQANEDILEAAHSYVSDIRENGSTDLHKALMEGLKLLRQSRSQKRAPMIFFLTDGEATAGVQNPERIISDVTRRNEGVVSIYSLAFGDGADYKLLRKISAKNNGFARKIYEASDSPQQVTGLYREISTVVLRDVNITYHNTSNNDDGRGPTVHVINPTITKCGFLFARTDFVVAGKLDNIIPVNTPNARPGGLQLSVSGMGRESKVNFVLEETDLTQLTLEGDNPFWTVPRDLSSMTERAWAFLTIKQLLKDKEAALEAKDIVEDLNNRILQLSLKYHFVTPLTSMVVTRPEDDANKEKTQASFGSSDELTVEASRAVQSIAFRPPSSPGFYHSSGPRPSFSHRIYRVHGVPSSVPTVPGMPGFSSDFIKQHRNYISSLPGASITGYRKNKSRRKTKKRKGPKKNKRKICNRKKNFLKNVLIHGSNSSVACFEGRGLRAAHNYTAFADPSARFSVTVGLRKNQMTAVYINHDDVILSVFVQPEGNLTFTPRNYNGSAGVNGSLDGVVSMTMDNRDLQVRHGQYTVRVKITRIECKFVDVSVDIDLGTNDMHMATVRRFSGFAAKYVQKQAKLRNRKRSAKSRKARKNKKVSKACLKNGYAQDVSFLVRGKHLKRHKA